MATITQKAPPKTFAKRLTELTGNVIDFTRAGDQAIRVLRGGQSLKQQAIAGGIILTTAAGTYGGYLAAPYIQAFTGLSPNKSMATSVSLGTTLGLSIAHIPLIIPFALKRREMLKETKALEKNIEDSLNGLEDCNTKILLKQEAKETIEAIKGYSAEKASATLGHRNTLLKKVEAILKDKDSEIGSKYQKIQEIHESKDLSKVKSKEI